MYAKLFARIAQSSIMEEEVKTRYVFMMLLAVADDKGDIIGTDIAIARMINIPKSDFVVAIERLKAPDPDSNSPYHEGRRLIPSDSGRGYTVVNYLTYRAIKSNAEKRDYMKNYMRDRRAKEKEEKDLENPVNSVKPCKTLLTDVTHTEAEAEAEADTEEKKTIHQQADKESIFPAGSRSKSIQEQKRTKVLGQMPLMAKIGKWLGRKETTLWNVAEAKALQQLNPSKDEIDAVEAYYSAKMPDAPYRMSIDTLLNNWSGEVDRANTYQPQQRKTAVELNEEAKQARRAYNMQNIF
jgi:hypothetical protein